MHLVTSASLIRRSVRPVHASTYSITAAAAAAAAAAVTSYPRVVIVVADDVT